MIGHGKQAIRVRRQINADDFCLLVDDVIYEPWVLMTEAVVVLPPDVRGEQIVERSDGTPPGDVSRRLQPLGVLIKHRINDVYEGFITVEEAVTTCEEIAFEPALTEMFAQDLHHATRWREVVVGFKNRFDEDSISRFKESVQAIRRGLVRPHHTEVAAR